MRRGKGIDVLFYHVGGAFDEEQHIVLAYDLEGGLALPLDIGQGGASQVHAKPDMTRVSRDRPGHHGVGPAVAAVGRQDCRSATLEELSKPVW